MPSALVWDPTRPGGDLADDGRSGIPPASVGAVSGYGKVSGPARAVNVHDLMLAEPLKQLDLPSPYYASGASTTKEHAYGTPIHFPQGFNGYKYWMVAAPYPTQGGTALSANKYENPTIYVSNDPDTGWISPPGVQSSPLFTSIGLSDTNSYYADPYIFAAPDSSKLYILFCWFSQTGTTKSSFLLTESTDGLNWSTPVQIASSTSTTFTPNSPSMIWNGTGWTMMAIDTRDGTGTFTLITSRSSGASPYTGWSAPSSVFSGIWSASTATHPLSRQFWHAHFVGGQGGQVYGFAADSNASGGTAYSLQSADGGLTFSVQPFSAWNTASAGGSWYRPGLCVCYDGVSPTLLMFCSRIGPAQQGTAGGFYMQKARLKEGRASDGIQRLLTRDMVHRNLAAPVALAANLGLLAWDSFNRADSATTLGNAESGQTWAYNSANVFGISTNRAYITSTANSIATLDVASQAYDVEVQIQTAGSSYYLVFSFQDASNFWRFGYTGSAVALQCISGGSLVAAKTWGAGLTITSGDKLGIQRRANGDITLLWNGLVVDCLNDTTFSTATKVGMQASGASATYFDNFIVRQG